MYEQCNIIRVQLIVFLSAEDIAYSEPKSTKRMLSALQKPLMFPCRPRVPPRTTAILTPHVGWLSCWYPFYNAV